MKSINESILNSLKTTFISESSNSSDDGSLVDIMLRELGFVKNSKGEYDTDGNFYYDEKFDGILVKNGRLTVKFGRVGGIFSLDSVNDLVSLDGCPKFVGRSFMCDYCRSLKNLIGAPQTVGEHFLCTNCKGLTSLHGAPKEVPGIFNCCDCIRLTNLEGCPRKIGDSFCCIRNRSLMSLDGCPERVGGDFHIEKSGNKFTKEDILSLCIVGGKIVC